MAQTVRAWRAYYGTGRVYDSSAWTPETLPREGLVCLMEYEDVDHAPGQPYRRLVTNGDWYWWDGARWQRVQTGDWETWQPRPSLDAIRSTTRLPDETYDAIIAQAMAAVTSP